jgi:hypothetical protein
MTTEAGKRMLMILPGPDEHGNGIDWKGRIDAIEAEAVAAERARIRAAVEGMFGQFHPMCAIEDEPTDHMVVSRKAVLAIVEGKP